MMLSLFADTPLDAAIFAVFFYFRGDYASAPFSFQRFHTFG